MNDLELEKIEIKLLLNAINQYYGYDFTNYSFASLKRRIESFIAHHNYRYISECISHVLHDNEKFVDFINHITVHYTEMFRDPLFFQTLRDNVFPILSTYPYINIWVAGCASGEEAYSIAILLHEAGLLERSLIYATDLSEVVLNHADEGIFTNESIREYTKNYQQVEGKNNFSDYYITQEKWAIMAPFLRRAIHFLQHNLVHDKVFIDAHLIVCRNVLIYFNRQLQGKVLKLFSTSLVPHGVLALGPKETIKYSDCEEDFHIIDKSCRLYRKNPYDASL